MFYVDACVAFIFCFAKAFINVAQIFYFNALSENDFGYFSYEVYGVMNHGLKWMVVGLQQ